MELYAKQIVACLSDQGHPFTMRETRLFAGTELLLGAMPSLDVNQLLVDDAECLCNGRSFVEVSASETQSLKDSETHRLTDPLLQGFKIQRPLSLVFTFRFYFSSLLLLLQTLFRPQSSNPSFETMLICINWLFYPKASCASHLSPCPIPKVELTLLTWRRQRRRLSRLLFCALFLCPSFVYETEWQAAEISPPLPPLPPPQPPVEEWDGARMPGAQSPCFIPPSVV